MSETPVTSDAILARLLTLHPKVIDLSLDRMERLLKALGDPHKRLPKVIHVAGTNGKGSVTAYLRAGLEAADQRVHVYTSPHLAQFHERIRLAGELIPESLLARILEECEAANAGLPITFFEITTCAAFVAFSRIPADWLILEVGLGGRLDATNVIDAPALSIITPVSVDHQQYLGETLAQIAGEKAGILKRGVPAVIGPQAEDGLAVIEARAAQLGAPLHVAGRDWVAYEDNGRLALQDDSGLLDLPAPALPGRHQFPNAGMALTALRVLGVDSAPALFGALTEVEWPARMQRLKRGPMLDAAPQGAELWLDGGHNPAAGEVIGALLADMDSRDPKPLDLIVGMINTKDVAGFLSYFKDLARRVYAVTIPGEAATLSAAETAAAARKAGLLALEAQNPDEAMAMLARDAAEEGGPTPRILICGSLYLAGKILRENG